MRRDRPSGIVLPNLPRRRFVQGLAAGGVMTGLAGLGGSAWAQSEAPRPAGYGTAPVLRGTEFDLVIAESTVNFTGKPSVATTINGMLPGPTLRWREGETVTIRVTNRLREPKPRRLNRYRRARSIPVRCTLRSGRIIPATVRSAGWRWSRCCRSSMRPSIRS